MFLGEVGDARDFLDELRFRHAAGGHEEGPLRYICDAPEPGIAGTRTRGTGYSLPLIAEVIAQRRRRAARLAGIGLPVAPVLVALEGPDAEADLALRRAQLDDLHLVGLVHLEVDLLAAVRVVELRHVNQPLDAV